MTAVRGGLGGKEFWRFAEGSSIFPVVTGHRSDLPAKLVVSSRAARILREHVKKGTRVSILHKIRAVLCLRSRVVVSFRVFFLGGLLRPAREIPRFRRRGVVVG